jgi:uncharacterized protein
MIKAVIDANVFISSALAPGSNPDKIIDLVRHDKIILVISQDILEEIREVFLYPKIKRRLNLTSREINDFLSQIAKSALITPGLFNLKVIKADPRDDKYLACALEGQADYIISGDKHLLNLKNYHRIEIVNPATFLSDIRPGNGWSLLVSRTEPKISSVLSLPVRPHGKNEKTMKKTDPSESQNEELDDLLSEYQFDYTTARPNRFASRLPKDCIAVTLDPDVAEVFTTASSVNTILRALITAMPATDTTKPTRKRPAGR